ncbi:hypothetical protein EYC80_006748 [Monilinia laxa]|uniref:N-acetyltransferase domain-containing protein n=1 Tax=Monilinia laxa TaxID=61186 RepID=A0A5N6JZG3_MONLA|nr:hypothetical protein EYC80_006748 [Monilinia laxa]
MGSKRMLDIKKKDPHTTFLKVVDTDTGAMIAKAKWNIWKGVIPSEDDLDGDYWETEEEKEGTFTLDILAVDPEYQRRGAGRLLVRWGTAIADELGYMAIVEASEAGRHLYESEGFEFVKLVETSIPEKWRDRKGEKFIWMEPALEPQPWIQAAGLVSDQSRKDLSQPQKKLNNELQSVLKVPETRLDRKSFYRCHKGLGDRELHL